MLWRHLQGQEAGEEREIGDSLVEADRANGGFQLMPRRLRVILFNDARPAAQ
ncbi:MAG: hypothetical protein ACM3S0_16275 [Acidobacteriota bacterium]